MTATHAELCQVARRWLLGPGDCRFVFVEPLSTLEIPDALGWRGAWETVLVEVKVSRADFLADRQKPHRLDPRLGMGGQRYFFVPAHLVKAEELPDRWGLVYAYPSGAVRTIRRAEPFGRDERAHHLEQVVLFKALYRLHYSGRWSHIEAAFGVDVPDEPFRPEPLVEEP